MPDFQTHLRIYSGTERGNALPPFPFCKAL